MLSSRLMCSSSIHTFFCTAHRIYFNNILIFQQNLSWLWKLKMMFLSLELKSQFMLCLLEFWQFRTDSLLVSGYCYEGKANNVFMNVQIREIATIIRSKVPVLSLTEKACITKTPVTPDPRTQMSYSVLRGYRGLGIGSHRHIQSCNHTPPDIIQKDCKKLNWKINLMLNDNLSSLQKL